jgi:hypothetical protein
MGDDLRAVLEGIVHDDDPKITAADRLRAAELLQSTSDREPELRGLLGELSDAELDAEWDRYMAAGMATSSPATSNTTVRLTTET